MGGISLTPADWANVDAFLEYLRGLNEQERVLILDNVLDDFCVHCGGESGRWCRCQEATA